MGKLSLFRSWLDEAIENIPQAKATADQWLAQLRKDPRVSMEEIQDRGLDTFFENQSGGVKRGDIQGYLQEHPVPWAHYDYIEEPQHDAYATPFLKDYYEGIVGNDRWTQRSGASPDHFDVALPGYQYHTRGGTAQTNLGNTEVLDEVQSDIVKNMAPRFDPTWRQPDDLKDARIARSRLHTMYSDPPMRPEHNNLDAALADAQNFLAEIGPHGDGYDLAEDLVYSLGEARKPYNVPARTRWEWQATARTLDDAIAGGRDALVWPSSETQYNRYFGDTYPDEMQAQVINTRARLADLGDSPGDRDLRDWASERNAIRQSLERQEQVQEAAEGSMQNFRNQYDKRMVRDKRWKQLGLKPELVDLEVTSQRKITGGSKKRPGKYWAVRLTPEVRERLAKSGIPYYMAGGMAILGQQEGAFDDGTF